MGPSSPDSPSLLARKMDGAVGSAYDGDGGCLSAGESRENGYKVSHINTKLCCCAEQEGLGVSYQRSRSPSGSYAHEYK